MKRIPPVIIAGLFLSVLAAPKSAQAHCDTLNGPVVLAAQAALTKGDVTPVLKWVKPDQEADIRAAFNRTLAVRRQSKEAAELADMYFFETLVRIHRAGEGAPYTGLQPAGAVDPGIAAADKALETGSAAPLVNDLSHRLAEALAARFVKVTEAKRHAEESVTAGREYVEAYVEFIHFYERLLAEAQGGAVGAHAEHQH
jgi:hypothetical protein